VYYCLTIAVYNQNNSQRYDGCIIFAHVQYTNLYPHWLRLTTQYSMRFELLNKTEYKGVQSIYTKVIDDMLRNVRHGVHIVFIQSGNIATFDFRTTLLTFFSCIGINSAIVFVLNFIATRCMSTKVLNNALKFKQSGDIRHLSKDDCDALIDKLQKMNLSLYDLSDASVDNDKAGYGPAEVSDKKATTTTTTPDENTSLLQQKEHKEE